MQTPFPLRRSIAPLGLGLLLALGLALLLAVGWLGVRGSDMAELMCLDALQRGESCGGHFREESQTPEGEARRDDDNFAYVAAWQFDGDGKAPILNKEPLNFEYVHLAQRSYK